MAYESYLNKDGTKREISMAEIGTDKHVIIGYVGKDGAVRRIPSLGRIDHFRIEVSYVSILHDRDDNGFMGAYVVESSMDSSGNAYIYFYTDSSKSSRYGYLQFVFSGTTLRATLNACTAGSSVTITLNYIAVYADGHECEYYTTIRPKSKELYLPDLFRVSTGLTVSGYSVTGRGSFELMSGSSYNYSSVSGESSDSTGYINVQGYGRCGLDVEMVSGSGSSFSIQASISLTIGNQSTDQDGNSIPITEFEYRSAFSDDGNLPIQETI